MVDAKSTRGFSSGESLAGSLGLTISICTIIAIYIYKTYLIRKTLVEYLAQADNQC